MEFDGQLVSELGVKRYLKGANAQKFSNLSILQSQATLNRRWQECDMGCHTPSYRVMKKELSYDQLLSQIEKISPALAGGIDGVHHETVQQAKLLGAGTQRTAEGLGVAGKDKFSTVGSENWAAYNFVRVNVDNLSNIDISLIDNPITQLVFAVVNEYVGLLPESIIADMVKDGAIVMSDSIDKSFVLGAVKHGLVEAYNADELDAAITFLNQKAERMAGKALGRKLTRVVASIIAAKIARKIMASPDVTFRLKRRIANMKAASKSARGNLGTALVLLLKANGMLGVAAEESRKLKLESPTLWRYLRNDLAGMDMMLFLVRGFVQEYIDRISLLENQPEVFAQLMASLVKAGKTKEIFFPG